MPFQLSWLLEGRVFYSRVYGTISDIDDATYDACVRTFLDQANGLPVHIITDYSGLEAIQTEIFPSHDEDAALSVSKHPALGCRVCILGEASSLLRFLGPLTSFGLKPGPQQFATLDLAIAHLCELDPSLLREKPGFDHTWPKPA